MKDIKFDFSKGIIVKNNAPVLISDNKVYAQNIKLEAVTVEGDLWYDIEYGWSLVDFKHRQIDEMLAIELEQRVREKLSKRDYVDQDSIKVELTEKEDSILVKINLCINQEEETFSVSISRVTGEVSIVE